MTGLRVDVATGILRKRLAVLKQSLSASEFRPEVADFASRTLQDCIATTPVRSEALIAKNQRTQYVHRVNFIPSYFELVDPSLRVNEMGQQWVYTQGKWYLASEWRLPDEVFAAYQMLTDERDRRLSTIESEFIAERKQVRFLYQRSWYQVAQSLGLAISVAAAIIASHTRRKPAKEPPKAFGQWRGGGKVLSVVIQNPFLDQPGKYWKGNGKQILAQATARNRPRFIKACEDRTKRAISAARRTA